MFRRKRHELEAENLVLIGKLTAIRDEIDEFLDDTGQDEANVFESGDEVDDEGDRDEL